METRIIRTTEDFLPLKDAWERIERTASQVSYFSTFRYNFDWWKAYEDDDSVSLFIVVVIHNEAVTAIAPMQIRTVYSHKVNLKVLEFLHCGGDYSNFVVDGNTSAEPAKMINDILGEIEKHQNEYDEIHLTHISQHTLLAHQILVSKYNKNFQYLTECPYIDFSRYKTYEEYTKAFSPKKIRQYINRFKREVNSRMEVTSADVVDELAKIHIAEKYYLKEKGLEQRHSFFENPRELAFRRTLYSQNDSILTYMLIDNTSNDLICYYTGYIKNEIFHSVTTAYNPEYANLAVGKIFNYMIFEENYQNRRWTVFDMGTGRYTWKFEMTDQFNFLYQLSIKCTRGNRTRRILSFYQALSSIKKMVKA